MSGLRVFPALVLALLVLVPSQAFACWDGFRAHVGNVDEMGNDTQWDEQTLRYHATWLGRIDALLPAGATLVSEHGFVTVTIGGTAQDLLWHDGHYRTLFDTVARITRTSQTDVQRALRTDTPVYVVQVGAFVGAARAHARADAISQGVDAEHGFFEAGGFPANNPAAHVVTITATNKLHRVYVGAFVNRAEAESLAKRIGHGAFVRELTDRT